MKKYLILLLFTLISGTCISQSKLDYIWLSGYTYQAVKGNIIDFNKNRKIDSIILGDAAIGKNNAIISDTEGNLMFFFHCC